MEENQLTIDVARLRLTSSRYSWSLPRVRKTGHLDVDQGALTVCYSTAEPVRLVRQLCHPSVDKLIHLLKRTVPEQFTTITRNTVAKLPAACHACLSFASRPISLFKLAMAIPSSSIKK
jgi:hypothetical protein